MAALQRGMAALAGACADQPAVRATLEAAAGGHALTSPTQQSGGEAAAATRQQKQQRQVPHTPVNAGAERQGLSAAVATPPAGGSV